MQTGQLVRRLGPVSAVSITVGAVIGSGIFLKPLSVSQALPSVAWIFVLWIGLGVLCLFGAFAYAELGAMFPEAGGQYAFLREGYGKGVAYLYGWTFFWAINSGTIAALALAFAEFLLPVFGVDMKAEKQAPRLTPVVAAAMILMLAVVNHFGVLFGAILQNVATFAKVGALALIVLGGLFVGAGDPAAAAAAAAPVGPLTLAGLVAAFVGIFWAYEGWYQLPFNAAELKRPERDLKLGLVLGMAILIVAYTAVNAIYLHVVPFDEMRALATKEQVPALTVARIFSPQVADYLTLVVAISVMGAANPNLLSSPRAFYAMAQDRLVPHALVRVSPRWHTPTAAIWVQAVWALVLVVVLVRFEDVTAFVVFASFIFYALTVGAVYVLRRTRPDAPRSYRCLGYPWTPALFIAVALLFIAALLTDPGEQKNALKGLAIVGAGVPAYFWQRRRAAAA
jgi:APA family basic amino acid/polyamine antiporter